MKSVFEYDPSKSRTNLEKHGIDFEKAKELWDQPVVRLRSRNPTEDRELVIGRIDETYWTGIITRRNGKIRIISVRKARRDEKAIYEENFG